jgi:hypothetical protein
MLFSPTSAQVLYDSADLKGWDPFLVLRFLAPQFDLLAGFQIGAAGQEREALVFLVIDESQGGVAALYTAGEVAPVTQRQVKDSRSRSCRDSTNRNGFSSPIRWRTGAAAVLREDWAG